MNLSFLKQRNLFGADMLHASFLRGEDMCQVLKEHLAPRIDVSEFDSMYKAGGRPPISPKVLVLVTVLQYLERLSDRDAAVNMRFRLDWKILLGLEVEHAGIHSTTLVKFRNRLLEHEKASVAFDKVLEQLIDLGLVKKGAKQRIDSTHVVGKVRELSRLEIFHETLKLVFKEAKNQDLDLPKDLEFLSEYYLDEPSIRGLSDSQKKKSMREAGAAMYALIQWNEKENSELLQSRDFKTLTTVFEQNFNVRDEELNPAQIDFIEPKPVATGKGHISNPHEPEASFSKKGNNSWIGYKGQVAETIPDEENKVGFITEVQVNDSTDHDSGAVSEYLSSQEEKNITPSEVYGDTHYNSEENIKQAADSGVVLKGPVVPKVESKKAENRGFSVDPNSKIVTCPQGHTARRNKLIGPNRVQATFSNTDCSSCPLRKECKPHLRGKRIQLRIEPEILRVRRDQMKTKEFKEDMHKRNGIEGTISGLVRGQGIRQCRYRGKAKAQLQLVFSAAAANVKRLKRYLELNEMLLQPS